MSINASNFSKVYLTWTLSENPQKSSPREFYQICFLYRKDKEKSIPFAQIAPKKPQYK